MATVNNHRVVIRRKKSAGGGHHGGSWKIAYADFVTAMMAFFLVMWLISVVPREELKGIAEYFRMPLHVALTGGPSNSAETSAIPGGGADPVRSDGDIRRADGTRLESQVKGDAERRDQRRLEQVRSRIEKTIDTSPLLKNFRPQLMIDMTPEGLRIQIIDNQNRPMFATGRAEPQPYMRDILHELAPVLNDIPFKISISGHTDATQYARGERAYSNWELSADRANASRQELVAGGMAENKVARVVGLSSSYSLVKDDPYAAVNRRISLVVLNRETQERFDRDNSAAADVSGKDGRQIGSAIEERLAPQPASTAPAPAAAGAPAASTPTAQ
ncbi:flagellar motor protein MotB [Bordetella genomosp. 10]|uniref:Flagellar motor protein MotB n=1 Tax=Bordetella genomosp. 10 TaxID=1416804 RepID=A0A261RZM4_9BORD|nr:flagellar motor protein MotB [Bordetella genomosp. 10]OZI29733.1 flagellar motor protein MotB [Bordetella genomosp. 10]